MLRFLKALVLLPVAVLVVLLAVANRHKVTLSLDPFSQPASPELAMQAPLFLVIFAAIMVGILIGGMAAWLAQGKNRREKRLYRREASAARSEAERLKADRTQNALPAPENPF